MIPDFIKQFMGEHIESIAPNDFEKTKLARKYNQDTKLYEEFMEIEESDFEKCRKIDKIHRELVLLGLYNARKREK